MQFIMGGVTCAKAALRKKTVPNNQQISIFVRVVLGIDKNFFIVVFIIIICANIISIVALRYELSGYICCLTKTER